MTEPAIEVRDLAKTFKGRRRGRLLLTPWRKPEPTHAVRGVDLVVRGGELVTLLGPNGAGKTTLLKILGALIRPTAGTARIHGIDVAAEPRAALERVGYILAEERSFYWRLSTKENLRFFAALQGLFGAAALRRVEELASLLGLTEHLDRDFMDLSSGQRQRVAIARGLLADPPVLLVDEATRSLDPGRAARIRRIIRELLVKQKGKAVLFATHDLEEAETLADRVVLMSEGKIACEGPFAAVESKIHEAFAAEAQAEEDEFQRLFGHLDAGEEAA